MASDINVELELSGIKTEIARRGLDLDDVWTPVGDDQEVHLRQLRKLLNWVEAYEKHGDRKILEAKGYEFPPVHPCIEPESDWLRFERWMEGKPVTHTLREYLPDDVDFPEVDELSDTEVEIKIEQLHVGLEAMGLSLDTRPEIPLRLTYTYLLEYLDKPMELLGRGVWHLDGCDGFCPGCFQRPWCESGGEGVWPEDEKAGAMYLTEEVRTYVSPASFSLKILEENKDLDIDMDDLEMPF